MQEVPPTSALLQSKLNTALRSFLLGGATPISASATPGDPGLLGPDSVSWRVLSDASSLLGGVRALLQQACHPLVMQGVADHSAFREDPLGRLHRTVAYVAVMTFGSRAEAQQMADVVNAAHKHVRGVMDDGTEYSADDPHLKLWVHCTLTESLLLAWQAYGPERLTADEADRFVSEQASTVELLGVVDPPRTVAELDAVLVMFRRELRATPATAEAARFIMRPPLAAAVLPAYQIVFWGAVALLENQHRDILHIPKVPPARLVTRALGRAFTSLWRAFIPDGDIRRTAQERIDAGTKEPV
jgi:uncharacterized protein (DUF2236 family)